jgi:hypothetical protein
MALTKFKQPEPTNNFDDSKCSFSGCGKPWAVHMEGSKPMCSHHQWNGLIKKPSPLLNKPVSSWYDIKDTTF